MKKLLALVIVLVFFSGCSIKNVVVQPDIYRLEPTSPLGVNEVKDNRVLRVQRVEGDSVVMTRSILYKKNGALKPYKYGKWSELLATRLQEIFTESIEKQKIFRSTVSSRSFAMADLILESNVENFEEIYQKEQSFVHVKIRFRLIQRKGAKILNSFLVEANYPIEQKGAKGVVFAFNKAVEKVIVDLNGWLHAK